MIKRIRNWMSYHRNLGIGHYMDRWYLVPPQWNLPFCVRLQHIRRPDSSRHQHNHPYAFKSIVLWGWYDEEQVVRVEHIEGRGLTPILRNVIHPKWRMFSISQNGYHRIVNMPSNGVWTLIWHPRKPAVYKWGYLVEEGKHVPHEAYPRLQGYELK